ncbi:unnamed protein product, partial [Prorocentrum cordatum]
SGRRARHRYGHNTCSSAKGWPCKSTNVLPCIITSAWAVTLAPGRSRSSLREACRPRAARRTPRPVGGRDACKLPWEGSLWKGVRPGPKRASEGLRRRRRRKPEGEHRTIVRMTRVASSRGRDRRAAAARKSGARPRRRGGAHGGCERAASAPVRESAGGPVGRAGRRSEEHEEREGRARRNRRGRRGT